MGLWRTLVGALAAVALSSSAASAAETVAYGPAPSWVKAIELPKSDPENGGAIEFLLQDFQVYFGIDADEFYVDSAVKVLNATGLQTAGQVGAQWDPAITSLTVNRLELVRDGKAIDLLAGGDKFLVLRRENNLALAMLDGTLTANKQIEDLRVGDVVRFSYTMKGRDQALGPHSEEANGWFVQVPIRRVYVRALWPKTKAMQVRAGAVLGKVETRPVAEGVEYVLDRQDFIPPEGPSDAPARYALPARIEFSDFRDWKNLSAAIAPLYQRVAVLKPDSPLQPEVDKIRAASSDPLQRAMAALKLVQEQVRYVYLDAGTGGYTPPGPEQTWSRRFGDCKGKTALLLALLKSLDVDALPVLVNTGGADGLDKQLPRMGSFNHVLVRADIRGKSYWLDGTMLDQRLEDVESPPNLDFGLPLTTAGSGLQALVVKVPERPLEETLLEVDASAGLYVEGPVKLQFVWRGAEAQAMRAQLQAVPKAQMEKTFKEGVASTYSWITPERVEFGNDPDGSYRITTYGKGKGSWAVDEKSRSATWHVDSSSYAADFDKRKDGVDQDAPYAISFPKRERYVTRIRLPRGGAGFSIVGDDVDSTIANMHVQRRSKLDGEWAVVEMELWNLAGETPVKEALAAAESFKKLTTNETVKVRAPRGFTMTTAESETLVKDSSDKAMGLLQRAFAKMQNRDFEGSLADYDESIRLKPDAETYLFRAQLKSMLGKSDQAIADLDAGIALDPKNQRLYAMKSGVLRQVHRDAEAITALLDAERAGVATPELLAQRAALRWAIQDPGAKADAELAVKADPQNGYILALAARYAIPFNMPGAEAAKQMLEALAPIAKSHPSDQVFAMQAGYFSQLRLFKEAIAAYDQAIALKAEPNYYWSRAAVRDRLGDTAEALADFNRFVELAPSKDSYWARADFRRKQKDYAGADADYSKAIAIAPDDFELQFRRIDLVRESGDPEKSSRMFDDLVKANPKSFEVRMARADAYAAAKDYERAIGELDAAAGLSPPDTLAKVRLNATYARTHEGAKRYDQAIKYWDTVVALDPKNPNFLNGRCWLKATRGVQLESALADCNAALALAPAAAAYLDSRALAELRLGHIDAALRDYDAALKASPNQAASLYGRGLARRQNGDAEGASADFEKAKSLAPKIVEEFTDYGFK
jgi:tetratricopeptide (TPR) repeat protein